MASIAGVLAGVLALGGTANARAFHSSFSHSNIHQRGENLINLRQDAPAVDDTPVIEATSSPVTLQPIRPNAATKKARRAGQRAYDLLSEDTLYWGGEDGTVAELWIDASGEAEALVDTEYFDDLVEGISCPRNGTGEVAVDFLDQVDLNQAGEVWSWVSQAPEHSFLLMVGAGDCGWNEDRMLYQVSDLSVTPDSKIATLHAQSIPWKDALHSYDLNVGQAAVRNAAPSSPEQTRRRRSIFDDIGDIFDGEINPDLSIPFDIDISGKGISFNMNGVDVSGTCSNCTTSGSFDAQAMFKVRFFDIEEAFIELSTPGINAAAIISLTVKGDITDALLEQSLPLFKASPAGVAIPGVITIGPTVTIALKAGISAIKGGLTVKMGGTAVIPPSNSRLDFLSEEGSSSEGWEPQFESVPLEADVFVEVKASTSLNAAVGLEVSALETGFAAELGADLPSLSATLKAISSLTCNACDQFQNAISGSVNLGTSISVALKKKVAGTLENLWSLSLFDASLPPLAEFCEPVGPQDACVVNGTFVG